MDSFVSKSTKYSSAPAITAFSRSVVSPALLFITKSPSLVPAVSVVAMQNLNVSCGATVCAASVDVNPSGTVTLCISSGDAPLSTIIISCVNAVRDAPKYILSPSLYFLVALSTFVSSSITGAYGTTVTFLVSLYVSVTFS